MTGMGVVQQILIGIVAGLIVVLIVKIIIIIKTIIISPNPPKYSKLFFFLIALLALLAFIALLLPENSQIQITDPEESNYVSWRYTVKGTSNIEPNYDLNIYVFIFADKYWYAQPKTIISSNGDWETRCKFGNREYVGLNYTYDICAIVTTKDFEVDEQFANLPDYKAKSEIITVTRE